VLIDWFTVGAQALNFVILVWLMKRFLYKPILHAIDAREQRIAAELADADAKKAEAGEERAEFQQKNDAFDKQRASLLRQATDEVKVERSRLLDEAREAAEALSTKRREALESDARDLSRAIGRRTREEVFAIARRALADLATTSLEERIGDVFVRRLQEMDAEDKGRLGEALKSAPDPAVVRSAFELPSEQQETVRNALNEAFSAEIPVRFETTSSLIGGIELSTDGQKVAWSIDDYVASLEKSLGELLAGQASAERKTGPEPAAIAEGEGDGHDA
jgi:F-type H+-transporting ATPase subunit b